MLMVTGKEKHLETPKDLQKLKGFEKVKRLDLQKVIRRVMPMVKRKVRLTD